MWKIGKEKKEQNRVLSRDSIVNMNDVMKPIIEAVANLQLTIKKSLENIDFSKLQELGERLRVLEKQSLNTGTVHNVLRLTSLKWVTHLLTNYFHMK